MRHQAIVLPLLVFLMALSCLPATADEEAALKLLAEKGLKKVNLDFKLDEEVELSKLLREGASMRKKVLEAAKKADAAALAIDQKKQLILNATQQRRQIRMRMENTRNVDDYNNMVTMINELADRITIMEKSDEHEKAAKAARGRSHQATEEYTEFLFNAERLYKRVKERYADLAADPKVTEAIAELSKAQGSEYRLGPSRTFLSAGKTLEGLLQKVVSEKIEIREGPGDLWYVSVMFNGKHAKEMSIDTGSSSIALPYALAKSMDMAPGPNAQEIQAQLADGTIIDCRRIFAGKVRVGPFTVENVECSVFPEDCIHAAPLLGMSFLQHFNYKIDNDRGELIMTRIDTGNAAGKVTIGAGDGDSDETDVKPGPPPVQPTPDNPKVNPGEPEIILVPNEKPVPPKPMNDIDAQIERLVKLLASDQGDGVTVTVADQPTEFSPSRSGPAARLKTRLGEPNSVVDVSSPNPAEEDAKWQVWSWGKLQLLVDSEGMVRYLKYAE